MIKNNNNRHFTPEEFEMMERTRIKNNISKQQWIDYESVIAHFEWMQSLYSKVLFDLTAVAKYATHGNSTQWTHLPCRKVTSDGPCDCGLKEILERIPEGK